MNPVNFSTASRPAFAAAAAAAAAAPIRHQVHVRSIIPEDRPVAYAGSKRRRGEEREPEAPADIRLQGERAFDPGAAHGGAGRDLTGRSDHMRSCLSLGIYGTGLYDTPKDLKTSQLVQIAVERGDYKDKQIVTLFGRKGPCQVAVISSSKAYMLKNKHLIGEGAFKSIYEVKEVFTKSVWAGYSFTRPDTDNDTELALMRAFRGVPGIIQVEDVVEKRQLFGKWFIQVILPLYKLGSLHDVIFKEPSLSLENKMRITLQILKGLKNMHDRGYVHRDIKPSNILVNSDFKAVIGDLGLAIKLSDPEPRKRGAGTESYYAPEYAAVVSGLDSSEPSEDISRVTTPYIDIYAMGLSLFQLYYSEKDLSTLTSEEILAKIHSEPRDVPDTLRNLICTMLSPLPENRGWVHLAPLLRIIYPKPAAAGAAT